MQGYESGCIERAATELKDMELAANLMADAVAGMRMQGLTFSHPRT